MQLPDFVNYAVSVRISGDVPALSALQHSQEELRAAFTSAMEWNVVTIEPDRIRRTTTTTVHRLVRDNQLR